MADGFASHTTSLLDAERRVLEQAAQGLPLASSLGHLVTTIEALAPGMLGSVLILDADGEHLRHGSAPHLPADYVRAIDGAPIGPSAGSCGTAAWTRQRVVAEDIRTDPRWEQWRDVALLHGLVACWSMPILSVSSKVLGTFAFYYREARAPDPGLLALIDNAAHVARIAIERHRMDAERAAMLEEMQRAVHFSEMFTGVLAHDLRNPLSAVLTSAELLKRDARAEDSAVRTRAGRIHASGMRMARMIDQLLDFTRARMGQDLPIERTPTDLAEVCQLAVDEVSALPEPREIVVEQAGDTRGVWDRDRLQQLLGNLLGNALQHGVPDRPVHLRVDGTDDTRVTLRVRNGGMIPPALIPVLFDPYKRVTTAAARRPNGLGLGLFISQQVARAHGGGISVSSSEQDGTCFTVTLPRLRNDRAESVSFSARDTHQQSSADQRTVVIVEDDDDLRDAMEEAFRSAGYQVIAASSGMGALEAIRSTPRPCAVVLDLALGHEHGSTVLNSLRADPKLAGIPAVVCTGDPSSAPSGVLILKKPVHAELLLETVGGLF